VAGVLRLIGLQIPDVPTPTSDAPLSP